MPRPDVPLAEKGLDSSTASARFFFGVVVWKYHDVSDLFYKVASSVVVIHASLFVAVRLQGHCGRSIPRGVALSHAIARKSYGVRHDGALGRWPWQIEGGGLR